MKRLFFLATVAAVALTGIGPAAPAAPAARAQAAWPIVYKDRAVAVALDTAGAKRDRDGSYLTRTRWDYIATRRLESKKPYTQMTQVALIRCTPVRIKRLTESFYDAGGAVVREGEIPEPGVIQYMSWDRLVPRSEGSRAFSSICATLARRDRVRR